MAALVWGHVILSKYIAFRKFLLYWYIKTDMTFTYLTNVHVRGGLLFNRLVHQKMKMVIIYSPCCFRPIQTLLIFGTKKYIFNIVLIFVLHCQSASTLCTHLYIVIMWRCNRLYIFSRVVVQQIVVQRCNRLCICNVVGVLCMVSSDSRCVSAVCACSPVELC